MCVKFPLGDLNPNLYPSHPTSTYTCGVTIAPRVCGGKFCKLKCLCIIFNFFFWSGFVYLFSYLYWKEDKQFFACEKIWVILGWCNWKDQERVIGLATRVGQLVITQIQSNLNLSPIDQTHFPSLRKTWPFRQSDS